MLDAVLDELAATLEEIQAIIQELDTRLGEEYEPEAWERGAACWPPLRR